MALINDGRSPSGGCRRLEWPRGPQLLVLRALGLGDLLTAVPALRALRRGLPGHHLVFATARSLSPLVNLIGGIDELHPTAGLGDFCWMRPAPQLAVNLHGRGPQSVRALLSSGAPRILTHRPRCLDSNRPDPDMAAEPPRPDCSATPADPGGMIELIGPEWDPGQHEVQRWCQLLGCLGIEADPTDLTLNQPVSLPRSQGAVVIHPGAAAPARRWPVERFAVVARALSAQGHQVVVTGSTTETALCTELVARAELAAEAMLAGALDLDELAALVSAARLVVCGDTGMGHLASAYRRPSVLLFGPTPPNRWGPPHGQLHTVLWAGQEGDPHADRTHPGLLAIEIADVLAAVDQQLSFATSPRGN